MTGPDPAGAWRRAAYAMVDAQAHLWASGIEALVSSSARAGAPGAAQAEAVLRRWTDAQRALLQSWLAAATGIRPAPGSDPGQEMLEDLRAGAAQLIDNQAEWARRWNAGPPSAAPRPVARP